MFPKKAYLAEIFLLHGFNYSEASMFGGTWLPVHAYLCGIGGVALQKQISYCIRTVPRAAAKNLSRSAAIFE